MIGSRTPAFAAVGLLASAVALGPSGEPPWEEILGPPEGDWPAPQDEVEWRADLGDALREARDGDRPLFVTLRCLPCVQCADFDRDVLEGGARLDPLLARFVTVRLTDARALDLNVFPVEGFQDMDLSWWGWFLSPAGRVYGIFGGRDHVSDSTRISVAALANTLERVLDHHADPRRPRWESDWEIDGPAPDLSAASSSPLELPGFAAWKRRGPGEPMECLHCHQVVEILRQPALDLGTFDKRADLAVWPLPENVGIVLDRDDGLLVKEVEPGSAAASAGLEPGDRLAAAGGRRLFGQADFRGALHRGPAGDGSLALRWHRGGQLLEGTLEVEGAWRETVLAWRTSVSQGNIGAHPGFAWAHGAPDAVRRKLGVPAGSMAIAPWFGREGGGRAWEAGLRASDVVVAVDGESPDVVGREFMAWFRLRHDPGDEVVLTARDGRGRDREVRFRVQ